MPTKSYTRETQYWETDQMGVIHHVSYIRWFEEARIRVMAAWGVPFDELERNGVLIPVLDVGCRYIKPARFPDTMRLDLELEGFEASRGVRFAVNYRVIHAATGELLTTGSSQHCFADRQFRVIRLKRDHLEYYERFLAMEKGISGSGDR